MGERPILFSGPMVNAILDGRKTQTRRVMPIVDHDKTTRVYWANDVETIPAGRYTGWVRECDAPLALPIKCKLGAPGDRLWVRETFTLESGGPDDYPCVVYRADRAGRYFDATSHSEIFYLESDWEPRGSKWRPSIFLPRRHSRITLEVTDVRVQRVQDISEDDSRAEGCCGRDPEPVDEGGTIYAWKGRSSAPDPRAHFAALWDSINGERDGCSWEANPWCWCVTFKRVEQRAEQRG